MRLKEIGMVRKTFIIPAHQFDAIRALVAAMKDNHITQYDCIPQIKKATVLILEQSKK